MFTTGNGEVSFSDSIGTGWNVSGSAGNVYNVDGLGQWGAEVSGSTSGNISLGISAVANGGVVDANIPASVILNLPSSVHPGEVFTVSANQNLSYGSGVSFNTQSPTVGFGVTASLDIQASAGAEICAGGCTGFNNTTLVDTGQQNITLLGYNEQLVNGTLTAGGNTWIALNEDVTSIIDSLGLSGSKDLVPNILSLTYNVNPDNLNFTATSSSSGNGTYTASGQTPDTVVGLDLNLANALAEAVGLPPLSGNLGDFVCDDLGVQCSSTVQNILNTVNYNLVSADATVGISPSQTYSMTLANSGFSVSLQMQDQNGQNVGAPVVLNAADSYSGNLTYPTQAANGSAITGVSIVPTLTLADPSFTTKTGLTIVPGFTLSGLGLSVGPIGFGPLSISPSIPPIPQLTLNTDTFDLGGFSSQTLASTSLIAPNITQSQGNSIPYANGTVNIAFTNLNATGQQTPTPFTTLNVHDATVVGGTFNGAASATTSIINDQFDQAGGVRQANVLNAVTINFGAQNTTTTTGLVNILNSTLNFGSQNTFTIQDSASNPAIVNISNSTFAFGAQNQFNTNGTVTISNSTLQSAPGVPSDSFPGIDVQSGTLTFQASTIANEHLTVAAGASAMLSQSSSMTTPFDHPNQISVEIDGTLTLDNSALTLSPNTFTGAQIAGILNLRNGATLHVGSQDELIDNGTINIGSGSVLQSDSDVLGAIFAPVTANPVGVINVAPGGTLTAGGSVTNLNINNGGTVNLNGVGLNVVIMTNPSGAPGGVVNVSGNNTLNEGSITGMSAIAIGPSAHLDLEGGVRTNSFYALQLGAASIINNGTLSGSQLLSGQIAYIGANSFINNGVITPAPATNFNGLNPSDLFFSGSVINTGSGLITTGGNGQNLYFTNLTNAGGTIDIEGGQLGVYNWIQAAKDTSKLTQLSGNLILNGELIATQPIELAGGSFSGSGTLAQGDLVNDGGIVAPGNKGSGSLTIFGNYTQGANGTLLIDFNSLTDLTRLVVEGDVNLAGTLEVEIGANLINLLQSDPGSYLGQSFDFLDFESLTGMFTNIQFVDSGLNPLAFPFDYTFDVRDPSGHLSLIWDRPDCSAVAQAILNGTAIPSSCDEFSANSPITPVDPSTVTLSNITLTAPSAVPEPGSLLLLVSGLAGIAGSRYRKYTKQS